MRSITILRGATSVRSLRFAGVCTVAVMALYGASTIQVHAADAPAAASAPAAAPAPAPARAKPDFSREYSEYVHLKKELAAAEDEAKKLAAKMPEVRQEIADIKDKDARIDGQIAALQFLDKLAFEKLGKEKTPDLNVAQIRSFLRDYPKSEYKGKAEELIKMYQGALDAEAAKRAKAEQDDRAARKALDDRFMRRELSLVDFRAYMKGKTLAEVRTLLGEPYEVRGQYWDYSRTACLTEDGRRRSAIIIFDGGRVLNVTLKPD